MVEGARLESVCRGNSTEGSNPSLSANLRQARGYGWQAASGEHHAKVVPPKRSARRRTSVIAAMMRSRHSAKRNGGRIPLSPPPYNRIDSKQLAGQGDFTLELLEAD